MFRFKMAAKKKMNFPFPGRKSHDQNLKITFPKEFFNKIWLKVEKHERIYIYEIKYIQFKNSGQNKFCNIAQCCPFMLISVKLVGQYHFFHQKMRKR